MKLSRFSLIRWIAIGLIFIAGIIFVLQLIHFSRLRAGFSPGTIIAGVPVGGLDQQQAAERLSQAYSYPIEIYYEDDPIQVKPVSVGFELDVEAMIAAADQQRVNAPFWRSFWKYLWNQVPKAKETPLRASIEKKRLRMYLLDEVSSRYDRVPQSSIPVPGSVNFQTGKPGKVLDIDQSIPLVEQVLMSPTERSMNLIISKIAPPRPTMENLEVLLKQIIDKSKFDGLTEMYILDLENRKELNFAYERGTDITPGISFTAASTIKIPIIVSIFEKLNEPTPQYAAELLQLMIEKSENDPADTLMELYLDPNIGSILVTNDMQALGLENTFLAGHFYLGAPLLQRYSTPANTRVDYTTDPDPYNQTTTVDMGILLDDIYQCAQTGGGTFAAVFPGEITQTECQLMITYLTRNKIAVLLQAGVPDGTKIGHKHGWITELDGLMHAIFDAGIVYSPGGNYVVAVAMYQPTQLIFDIANQLAAQLSAAVYNYFNITQ
ncbi:MAG TPA: hypothetical protein G4N92_01815 [Anaerolineae bacterium]|nr:hypothetical protein [Anaerolineae bacterium]